MLLVLAGAALGQQAPPDGPPPTAVQLIRREQIPYPDDFEGERPYWQTNRYGQVLLVDADGDAFAVDQAGRTMRPVQLDEAPTAYRFPMKYLERWSPDWRVVTDDGSAPLEQGPDFTGAALVERWGEDRRDALLRLDRGGVEVWTVQPPADVRSFPTCVASVPESCLAAGVGLLRESAGDPDARKVAAALIDRACRADVVRACFHGVALRGGRDAAAARACLDGEAEACAVVAGSVHAEAKLRGEPSEAGERMLTYACEQGVAGACSEAARVFDERDLPHNALLMLDRACVSGDRAACDEVEQRRDRTFAQGIAKSCLRDEPDPIGCITLAQFLEDKPIEDLGIDAFEAWSRACAGGEEPACRAMGPYVDRWGMDDARVQRTVGALQTTCDAGSTRACVGAAHLLVRLDTRDPGYARARQLYSDACAAGDVRGCLAGAAQSWAGPAARLDLPDATALYTRACEADSPAGCAGLGRRLSGQRRRTDDAIAALDKGCQLGSADACTQLGVLALEGRHQATLDPRAIFEQGCDAGEPEACYQLGRQLAAGEPVAPTGEAAEAFAEACDGGRMAGCEALGMAHLGRGTHYEAGVAAGFLRQACEGGRMDACSQLGLLYRRGHGVPRDGKQARELLVRAGKLQPVKHLRLGARLGFLNLLGLDVEGVLPIPVGPAISIGGDFSYLPGSDDLSMSYVGPTVRVYPSRGARGLYAAAGWHQFRIQAKEEVTTNAGFNGRVGVRVQRGHTFGGVEIGLATVDAPRVAEIIRPIPLVVPVFGVSGGVALF